MNKQHITMTTRSGSSFNTWFKKSFKGSYESLSDVVNGPTAIKTDKVSKQLNYKLENFLQAGINKTK